MAMSLKKIIVFALTMISVMGIFYAIGYFGWLDGFEDSPVLYYGIAVFAALVLSFGLRTLFTRLIMGEVLEDNDPYNGKE